MRDLRLAGFALVAVALMALSPLALAEPWGEAQLDASGSMKPATLVPKQMEYMYAVDTSSERILGVRASTEGSRFFEVSSERTSDSAGASNISSFWYFDRDTGRGPFNTFYAAVNIIDGNPSDGGELALSKRAGTVAYVLDPYDLSRTLSGTELSGTYNIMLIVPTVYWKADGETLYLSSSPDYDAGGERVSGMVAYAHCAGDGKAFTNVYPYIGIGVYEATVSGGKLLSTSGTTPTGKVTCGQFASYADALDPADGSDYQ